MNEQTQGRKQEYKDLMRFENCLYHRVEEERDLINQSITRYNNRGNTPRYIAREFLKKKKQTDQKLDQK